MKYLFRKKSIQNDSEALDAEPCRNWLNSRSESELLKNGTLTRQRVLKEKETQPHGSISSDFCMDYECSEGRKNVMSRQKGWCISKIGWCVGRNPPLGGEITREHFPFFPF
jgi:hypothetical protein